jgi:hypothetical protein
MNCKEFETQWAALEDNSRLTAPMEDHCGVCRHCSDMVEDLISLLEQARQMRAVEDPPQRVWVALRNQLEQEGLLREPVSGVSKPRWNTAPSAGWLFRLPMGLAYAAVFFVAVGVMYMQSRMSNPSAPPLVAVTAEVPDMAWVRPDTSDSDQNLQALLAKVPEEQRATMLTNWNQVNSSIQNLQTFIEANPDDPFAPPQLMNAFQQRERLRETLVRWEEF